MSAIRAQLIGTIALLLLACAKRSEHAIATPIDDASADAIANGDASTMKNAEASMAPDAEHLGEPIVLFDGTLGSDWRMSTITNQPGRDDPGHFTVEDGALVSHPGTDIGLLWNTVPTPRNFVLELEFRLSSPDDNSGVFVRFPDLDSKGYDNTAFVAVDFGFEVQIDEKGAPDGAPEHTTGAIYNQKDQEFSRVPAKPPGEWNAYEIRVDENVFTVTLNGARATRFVNSDPVRGAPGSAPSPAFVGLQTHAPGTPAFRNVRIREILR